MNELRGPQHPWTLPSVVLSVLVLVVVVPEPWGPLTVALAGAVAALVLGPAAVTVRAAVVCFIPWVFLILLHGVFGEAPRTSVVGLPLSKAGLATAQAQGARLYAVLVWSLLAIARLDPSRFLDAAATSGRGVSGSLALVATLQAIPRLGERASRITAAQRARGLKVRGSLLARLKALAPLALPLVLGAIIEADDRTATLELRGASSGRPRTALQQVDNPTWERAVRWGALALALGALGWRALL